jgi:hypothetical protein
VELVGRMGIAYLSYLSCRAEEWFARVGNHQIPFFGIHNFRGRGREWTHTWKSLVFCTPYFSHLFSFWEYGSFSLFFLSKEDIRLIHILYDDRWRISLRSISWRPWDEWVHSRDFGLVWGNLFGECGSWFPEWVTQLFWGQQTMGTRRRKDR